MLPHTPPEKLVGPCPLPSPLLSPPSFGGCVGPGWGGGGLGGGGVMVVLVGVGRGGVTPLLHTCSVRCSPLLIACHTPSRIHHKLRPPCQLSHPHSPAPCFPLLRLEGGGEAAGGVGGGGGQGVTLFVLTCSVRCSPLLIACHTPSRNANSFGSPVSSPQAGTDSRA